MKRNHLYLIIALLLIAMAAAGCSDSPTAPTLDEGPAITRVWIEGALNVSLGGTTTMKAMVMYEDGTIHDVTKDAAWDTLDPAVATADKGLVTAVDVGVTQVRIRYRGVTFSDFLGVPTRGYPQGSITLEGYSGVDQALQLNPGETRQLKITIRYPDATTLDVTDRVVFDSSNPAAISVDAFGVAVVHVAQGATDLWIEYRGQYAPFTLQVGDPLPKQYEVYVEAFKFTAINSCDSATNADGGDGEFNYQINVVTPTSDRLLVAETPNYPDKDHVIHVDQNSSLLLSSAQLGPLSLSEIQALEVEVRVTEWDLQWTDFGDPIHESEMDDMHDSRVYRGADGFSPGVHTINLTGSSDCEVEVSFRIIAVQL